MLFPVVNEKTCNFCYSTQFSHSFRCHFSQTSTHHDSVPARFREYLRYPFLGLS